MNEVFNHLWQSTAFAGAVALACVALRRNSPRLRYWLWLAASMKFLIPFAPMIRTGERIQLPPDTSTLHAVTVQQISTYFAPVATTPLHAKLQWPMALAAIWFAGAALFLMRWFRRWRTMYFATRQAKPLPLRIPVRAFASPSTIEPGIFGIFRPVLLLPDGIADNLTPEQFEAVLVHELRHLRYRDNLTAALHMCVETLFWFHPLVWWVGARLMDERERDCDEAVLRQGSQPGVYARGIVQVCEAYVPSPLPCASGISGSDLKKRIREIMTWRESLPVTLRGKATLALAALAAISIPFAIGILRAQTLPRPPAYTYDVVSIHPSAPGTQDWRWEAGPSGGLKTSNTSVTELLTLAYQVQDYQLIGAPRWASSNHYDIILTPAEPDAAPDSVGAAETAHENRNWQRLQAVLCDRFRLMLRTETRQLPVYALTRAAKGAKISQSNREYTANAHMGDRGGQIEATGAPIQFLSETLGGILGRPVIDETGLTGVYDFKLDWTGDINPKASDHSDAPSIFTALTDQLGLRLQSKKGPVVVYVIEKIQPPTDN